MIPTGQRLEKAFVLRGPPGLICEATCRARGCRKIICMKHLVSGTGTCESTPATRLCLAHPIPAPAITWICSVLYPSALHKEHSGVSLFFTGKFCKWKQGWGPRFAEPETVQKLPVMCGTLLPTGRRLGTLPGEPGWCRQNGGDGSSSCTLPSRPPHLIPPPHAGVPASLPLLEKCVYRDVRHAVICKMNLDFQLLGNNLTMAQNT